MRVTSFKATEEIQKQLYDQILFLVRRVGEGTQCRGCVLLRLVIVSSDFHNEVRYWQRELKRAEGTTLTPEAETGGKTLVWGDGRPDFTRGIIIIPDKVAAGLLIKQGSHFQKNTGDNLFVHELTHVHTGYLLRNAFGEISPSMNNDWIGIQKEIAISIWEEWFAELIANRLFPVQFGSALSGTISMLRSGLERIDRSRDLYRINEDIVTLWAKAVDEISLIFNQFGGVLGLSCAAAQKDNSFLSRLVNEISRISLPWSAILGRLHDELLAIAQKEDWSSGKFSELSRLVQEGFFACGLLPIQSERGLKVHLI